MNKTLPLLLSFILWANTPLFSQIDVKTNPITYAFGDYGIYGEYSLSESISSQLGIFIGESLNERIINQSGTFNHFRSKGFRLMPSFRYYPYLPNNDPTNGNFFEFFAAFEWMKSFDIYAEEVPVDANGNLSNYPYTVKVLDYTPYTIKNNRFGLGLNYGYKFTTYSGFILEFFLGPRLDLVETYKHENLELEKYVKKMPKLYKESRAYLNFGINFGWRF
ncbi:MAG: DUF3575 domain-containing protein [Flavobacteriales bacterium]|jgi:hypothetical protein|nr:DUF3575 domain-containing protein [Flavobacteriales bacterium]